MSYLSDPTLVGQDVGTIITLALENLQPGLIDTVSKALPGYEWLVSNGRLQYEDGGYQIRRPVITGKNNTIKSYLPGDTYNLERPTGFDSVKYGWGFIGGGFIMDGPTEFMTSGKYGIVNLTQTYIDQLKTSFSQAMSDMLYGDGTGNNGADLLGLDILVEAATSTWSTVGGIDPDVKTWWKNTYDASLASTAWDVSDGLDSDHLLLLKHYLKVCTKPPVGKCDLLLTCLDQYEAAERCIQRAGTIQLPSTYSQKYYDYGWGGLRIDGVTTLFDMNLDGHATMDNTWFGLNSKCLAFVVGKNKAFVVDGPIEHPLMDAKLWKAKMYAQLCVLNRRDAMFRV
jgi:hypothetical protein